MPFDPLKNIDPVALLASPVAKLLYTLWNNRRNPYRKIDRYMAGDHDLSFATEKFSNAFGGLFREHSENQCPTVVSSLSDPLQYEDVSCDDDGAVDDLTTWLDVQVFPVLLGQINSDAVTYGNAYAATGMDDEGNLRIYRQDARQCAVLYDPIQPDRILAALKIWQDPILGVFMLNLTTRSATYHYVAQKSRTAPKLASFEPFIDDRDPSNVIPPMVEHAVDGICPVWHFPYKPDAMGQGISALSDVFPLQDTLNKTKCDRLVGQEFQAFRQRWATGIEQEIDPDTGLAKPPVVPAIDRLWFTSSENAKFGDFEAIDLTQFLAAAESDRKAIAAICKIPAWHLVSMTGDFPSGESLKTAMMPLLQDVRDRQLSYGATWASLFRYWYLATKQDCPKNLKLGWVDITPRDKLNEGQGDNFEAQAALTWNQLGVPKKQLLLEKGYTPDQIEDFADDIQEEKEQDAANAADALAQSFNAAPTRPGAGGANMNNVADPGKSDGMGKKPGGN